MLPEAKEDGKEDKSPDTEPGSAFESNMTDQTRQICGEWLRATLSTSNVPEYLEGAFGNFEMDDAAKIANEEACKSTQDTTTVRQDAKDKDDARVDDEFGDLTEKCKEHSKAYFVKM